MAKNPSIVVCLLLVAVAVVPPARGQSQITKKMPQIFADDFDNGIGKWEFKDAGWKLLTRDDGRTVLSQHRKSSDYEPPFRSPLHIALVQHLTVNDFQIDVNVLSTHSDYNHRDVCLFFGFQNAAQFYYVHLGKQTDPHANQVFIVNKAARKKISLSTTQGTPWDHKWHHVRVTRNSESGEIRVFFDDMQKPAMTANDKTFNHGQVGIGSFDDTADWDDFVLAGKQVAPRNGRR